MSFVGTVKAEETGVGSSALAAFLEPKLLIGMFLGSPFFIGTTLEDGHLSLLK